MTKNKMTLIQEFKFKERFKEDNFLKFISIGEYNKVYNPQVDIPHTHNYYLIMYITAGSGKHFIDFKEYSINKNALYLISPGQVHSMQRSGDTDGFDIIFEEHFFCSGVTKNEIILPPPFFRNGLTSPYIGLDNLNNNFVFALIRRIGYEFKNEIPGKWEIIRSILNILIHRIEVLSLPLSSLNPSKYKRAFKVLNDFRLLVEKHFLTEKSIAFYADKLAITPNHLSETIREVTGETPVTTIRKRTLLKSKSLLLESEDSIKEIGYKLGFESVSYFIKLFKEETGYTPSQFREKAASLNS